MTNNKINKNIIEKLKKYEYKKNKKKSIKKWFIFCNCIKVQKRYASLPNNGIASDTCGNVSATKLRNTVSDSRIVTPTK